MNGHIINMKLEDPTQPFEQKVFVCVVDGIVVGNIANFQRYNDNTDLIPVFMPKWELLVKILQSPNHKFIENSRAIVLGTIWDGQDFIAPNEPIDVQFSDDNIGVYINVGKSCIYYENNLWIAVKDYTFYIIDILKELLLQLDNNSVNIIINGYKQPNFNNNNKIIKLGINFDQNIVSDEIQNLAEEPINKVDFNGKKYTVKLEMYDFLNQMDTIFEYSKPNIKNIEISGLFTDYFNKLSYIAPCVYKNVVNPTIKSVDTLTLFTGDYPTDRRENILTNINIISINHRNENNCYGDELGSLLENTKILINIHQSDFENTFEEIRVLPALQKRVLVISEISALSELVPFNPLIIWATYDNIVEKTKEVLDNYETYYNQIFTEQNIILLNNLHSQNVFNIQNKLNYLLNN